jgi:hypothetical protein
MVVERPSCQGWGAAATLKDRDAVELGDLSVSAGRPG